MLDNGLNYTGLFQVVHPAKKEDCSSAVVSYMQHLVEPNGSNPAFSALTLEECVQGLRQIGEAELADALFARHLEFDRIEAAILGQEVHLM